MEAGYIIPFLVCPSDAALPSAVRVTELIPTDLTYTSDSLHEWLHVACTRRPACMTYRHRHQ